MPYILFGISFFVKCFMGKALSSIYLFYFSAELKVWAVQMATIFGNYLPLSKDLDPQENMHGEELLAMLCNLLIQVCTFKYVVKKVMNVNGLYASNFEPYFFL